MANSVVIGRAGQEPARTAAPSTEPSGGPVLRLWTWLRQPWLDAAIARGSHRPGDRALALRRAQLVDRRQRTRLALAFEEILTTRMRPSAPSSAVPVDREAVDAARPMLTELVLSLRSSEDVDARGVVLGRRLLTDPVSPIYVTPGYESADGARLWRASLLVLMALGPLVSEVSPWPW